MSSCAVCLDCVLPSHVKTSLPCGHSYHYSCIASWLKRSETCPECRGESPTSDGLTVLCQDGILSTHCNNWISIETKYVSFNPDTQTYRAFVAPLAAQ